MVFPIILPDLHLIQAARMPTDADSSDADIKDADSDKKEEKDDETDSEKEKEKAETTTAADMQKTADEAAKSPAETAATPSPAAVSADATAAAPAETATAPPTSYIAKEALNIRRTPDEKAQVVANYQAGETLNVTEDDSTHTGWLKVIKSGVEGYVSKDFVNVN